jgi:mRNA interferase RelE/StbE
MFDVLITGDAREQIARLPMAIQARIQTIVLRLAHWPNVSGAKSLRHVLQGAYRMRTGDYRVLFRVETGAKRITVFRVADRRDVYE